MAIRVLNQEYITTKDNCDYVNVIRKFVNRKCNVLLNYVIEADTFVDRT